MMLQGRAGGCRLLEETHNCVGRDGQNSQTTEEQYSVHPFSVEPADSHPRGGFSMCRPFGTRLIDLILPGTAVPGYRLFRPFGTASCAI
jgi:hypothetical protein